VPQIFLADSIENGAGFTTWLREPGRFAQLIEDCLELIATDWDDPAIHDCGSSCPAAFETGQTRRITRSWIGDWLRTPRMYSPTARCSATAGTLCAPAR
jgi:hypothetical protein